MLRVVDAGCRRGGRLLFSELFLEVEAGECVELHGPNGSGKSTLLRCIAGLYPDFEGEVEAAEFLYAGHRMGLNPLLSAEQNLAWYAALRGDADAVGPALERVGMAGYERTPCQHLSAGQQRRVALARLLVCPASLWLLDEPLTALDRPGRETAVALLTSHVDGGGAVVAATHQPLGLAKSRVLSLGR
ncbi:MAG: heme ABC exporter ATP-binding protein CcmA [Pseudomonadales bacterium]|nr:heme ABC exporter ATP-binding protein CcmA [Pseudomonadales bacterium]NIX08444.1 heme ABC exporter ATP-binding protein CcmA [Pseudomonadales bacterium]